MTRKDEDAFSTLKTYCEQLKKSLTLRQKTKADHLVEVGYHIRICDHIVEKNNDKIILFTTFRYWLECRKKWAKDHPHIDVNRVIPNFELKTKPFHKSSGPEKTSVALTVIPKSEKTSKNWSQSLTRKDYKLLKSLKIDPETTEPEPEPEPKKPETPDVEDD